MITVIMVDGLIYMSKQDRAYCIRHYRHIIEIMSRLPMPFTYKDVHIIDPEYTIRVHRKFIIGEVIRKMAKMPRLNSVWEFKLDPGVIKQLRSEY
jgi:hypothetical protein